MAQRAAHLVDHVIPHVPVCQWVRVCQVRLPIPLRLCACAPVRLFLAAQPKLVTPVLQVVHRVITRHLLDQARLKAEQAKQADSGAVMLIQPSLWMKGSAANLMVTLDGDQIDEVKITDFGSALNMAAEQTQVYRVGSLACMLPEQLGGDLLDCRADIYSLSDVLSRLIAGRPPFDALQQAALMHQICNATPLSLAAQHEGIAPQLPRTQTSPS